MEKAYTFLSLSLIIAGTVLVHIAMGEILYYTGFKDLLAYTVGMVWILIGVYFVTSKKSNS